VIKAAGLLTASTLTSLLSLARERKAQRQVKVDENEQSAD